MTPERNEEYFNNTNELLMESINNQRMYILGGKPHIKKYLKIRKMHSEIVNTMAQYYHEGKFIKRMDTNINSKPGSEMLIDLHEDDFDIETEIGGQSFYDIVIYKMASNENCITDDFIRNNRYRKPEKIEFLHSMLDSKPGLFEVT